MASDQIQHVQPGAVFEVLHSHPDGLTDAQVRERLREVGPNRLHVAPRLWWFPSLVRQFSNFFAILLDIAAAICFVADHVQPGESMNVMGWALLTVSVVNALFSFAQECRAEHAMHELRKFLPQQVLIRRDGREFQVVAEEIVPGDIVILREGDKVPADARLIGCDSLTVSNAPLTGESQPVALSAEPQDTALIESNNLVFAGCAVLRGSGRAVVFATGLRTEFGRIASLSHEIRRKVSPLERETAHMVRVLTVIAVTMGIIFFIYGIFAGRSLWVNLVFMMGIIVANVPEGLLPTFTLSLAISSLRMARRQVLVKSLSAVEALGAIHVICTDKTGTLTENRLAVVQVVSASESCDLTSDEHDELLTLALIACDLEVGEGALIGDPLDVAIAQRRGGGVEGIIQVAQRVTQKFPFDIKKRRAAGIARLDEGLTFCVKGAWESLKPMVGYLRQRGSARPHDLTPSGVNEADRIVHDLAAAGYRVIALAGKRLDAEPAVDTSQDDFEQDLVLHGFLGLEDPLRPEVADAVATCHGAGIRVIMITGDHPATATAIANRAGIVKDDAAALTITGEELARMREAELIDRLSHGVNVFARTTPEQKMKIVAALHEMDQIVAVTGDGVNDAPALKAADVGVAMGKTGTDVARECAQVILLNDNFASIVAGVEEGRTIFANIRKFTNYVLVSNGPEIMPYILYMIFPVPLALTVIQILTIDLGTDIIPSMALGREPPEPGVMEQSPRRQGTGLLTLPLILHSYAFLGLVEAAFSLSLFFLVLWRGGWHWGDELSTADPLYHSATGITLSTIMLMQTGNVFGRRSCTGRGIDRGVLRNRLLLLGIMLEAVLSWAVLYFPPLCRVLGTGPVPISVYLSAWLGAPLIFGLDYARKVIVRRFQET